MKGLYDWLDRILDIEITEDYMCFTQSKGHTYSGLPFTLDNYADSDSYHLMLNYHGSERIPVWNNKAEMVFSKHRDVHNTLLYILYAGDGKTPTGVLGIADDSPILGRVVHQMIGYKDFTTTSHDSCYDITSYSSKYEVKLAIDSDRERCKVIFTPYVSDGLINRTDSVYITYPLHTRLDIVELVKNVERDFFGDVLSSRG